MSELSLELSSTKSERITKEMEINDIGLRFLILFLTDFLNFFDRFFQNFESNNFFGSRVILLTIHTFLDYL